MEVPFVGYIEDEGYVPDSDDAQKLQEYAENVTKQLEEALDLLDWITEVPNVFRHSAILKKINDLKRGINDLFKMQG